MKYRLLFALFAVSVVSCAPTRPSNRTGNDDAGSGGDGQGGSAGENSGGSSGSGGRSIANGGAGGRTNAGGAGGNGSGGAGGNAAGGASGNGSGGNATGGSGGSVTGGSGGNPDGGVSMDTAPWVYVAPAPGEHPRLFFRQDDLPALKARAATAEGAAWIAKLGPRDDLKTENGRHEDLGSRASTTSVMLGQTKVDVMTMQSGTAPAVTVVGDKITVGQQQISWNGTTLVLGTMNP